MSPLILADLAHEIPGSIVRQPFQRGILVLRSPNPGQLFTERPRTKCSVSSTVTAHRSPCQEVGPLRRVVCEPPSAPPRKQPFRVGNGILYIHYSDLFHRTAGSTEFNRTRPVQLGNQRRSDSKNRRQSQPSHNRVPFMPHPTNGAQTADLGPQPYLFAYRQSAHLYGLEFRRNAQSVVHRSPLPARPHTLGCSIWHGPLSRPRRYVLVALPSRQPRAAGAGQRESLRSRGADQALQAQPGGERADDTLQTTHGLGHIRRGSARAPLRTARRSVRGARA